MHTHFKAELPQDEFFIDNMVFINLTDKFTLLYAPQYVATNWIRKMTELENKKLLKLNSNSYNLKTDLKMLKNSIKTGGTVMLFVDKDIHPG